MSGSAGRDAMLRMKSAPTMMQWSAKENVLPTQSTAKINFRIHPRDTLESAVAHMRAAIDDPAIEIGVDETTAIGASPVSQHDTQG